MICQLPLHGARREAPRVIQSDATSETSKARNPGEKVKVQSVCTDHLGRDSPLRCVLCLKLCEL